MRLYAVLLLSFFVLGGAALPEIIPTSIDYAYQICPEGPYQYYVSPNVQTLCNYFASFSMLVIGQLKTLFTNFSHSSISDDLYQAATYWSDDLVLSWNGPQVRRQTNTL